ncbi:unnamed protein product, partial [Closterium sp. NIES-54]
MIYRAINSADSILSPPFVRDNYPYHFISQVFPVYFNLTTFTLPPSLSPPSVAIPPLATPGVLPRGFVIAGYNFANLRSLAGFKQMEELKTRVYLVDGTLGRASDGGRIEDILINLIGNALKFTPKGHVFIAVRLATPADNSTNDDNGAPPSLLSAASSTSSLSPPSSPSPSSHSKKLSPRCHSLAGCFTSANSHREGKKDPAEGGGPTDAVYGRSGVAGVDGMSDTVGGDDGTRDDNDARVDGSTGGSSPVVHSSTDPGCLTLSGRPAVETWCSWEAMREHMDLGVLGKGMANDTCRGRHDDPCGLPPDQPVRLMVAVEDTGTGIPRHARRHIFRPYTQAERSTARLHGGTGIGLSICK